MGYIYILTCLVTMKEYVGQAACWKRRWKAHCKLGLSGCPYALHRAMRKYGAENFAITIVRRCPADQLNYWEEYYVDKFETQVPDGYNMTTGGDGVRGVFRTKANRAKVSKGLKKFFAENPEAVEAMRQGLLGRKLSKAHKKAIGRGSLGRVVSPETRRKIGLKSGARRYTPEQRARMSEAHKGIRLSEEHKARIGAGHQGKKRSEEARAAMSAAQYLRYQDPAVCRTHSPEACANMAKAQRIWRARQSPEQRQAIGKKISTTRRANIKAAKERLLTK